MRSQGDIAFDFLQICMLLMANLLGHLKSDYFSQYKTDFVNNYISPGLQSGQNVPLLRIALESYIYLLPYLSRPPISIHALMTGILAIFGQEPQMPLEDQMEYIQQIFILAQISIGEVRAYHEQIYRVLERVYQNIHQIIQKRNPFQLQVCRKFVINLSDISSILVHSLVDKKGLPKYENINTELLGSLHSMNLQILVQF